MDENLDPALCGFLPQSEAEASKDCQLRMDKIISAVIGGRGGGGPGRGRGNDRGQNRSSQGRGRNRASTSNTRGRGHGRGGGGTRNPSSSRKRRSSGFNGFGYKRRKTTSWNFKWDGNSDDEGLYNSSSDNEHPLDDEHYPDGKHYPGDDEHSEEPVETNDEHMGEAETYAEYKPSKLKIGKPHPDPVVETASLATVKPPDITYRLTGKIEDRANTGSLSALQLETVVYACQQHERFLPSGIRAGYLIGDGAGVGKGRTIAGIILENHLRGRKKAIWISVSGDLIVDAQRDFTDIKASKMPVHPLNKTKYGPLHFGEKDYGVVFATYSALIGSSKAAKGVNTRLDQLVKWCGSDFEGVIVFDECHRAKNLWPASGTKPTKTGQAVSSLQDRLPKARIVYASATGASEPRNMAYMVRLGLWGPGTAFKTTKDFVEALEKRGISAMELVAMDLKLRGTYLARQLSFQGATFSIEHVSLDDEFIEIYDESVKWWVECLENLGKAMELVKMKKTSMIRAQFWAAHQRFFKYLCLAGKVNRICQVTKDALANDKCIVIGLQSTGEARTADQIGKTEDDLEEFVSTAKGVMECFIDRQFPSPGKSKSADFYEDYEKTRRGSFQENIDKLKSVITRHVLKATKKNSDADSDTCSDETDFEDENGLEFVPGSGKFSANKKNSKGHSSTFHFLAQVYNEPTVYDVEEAYNIRRKLKESMNKLGERLPKNTLDMLIDGLGGHTKVAEMTGRRNRLLKRGDKVEYCSRGSIDVSLDDINIAEKNKFMEGKKLIAIISEAASCGISLQSDKRVLNQKRRVHITLELPWSADRAIQQFGRTHRSNQSSAPEYLLLITDLAGENRFASAVAKRLESLGALTHGDRRAAQARDMSRFQMDNKYGRMALNSVFRFVRGSEYFPVKLPPELSQHREFVRKAMEDADIIPATTTNMGTKRSKNIAVFLNRLLGLPVALQNIAFSYFSYFLDSYITKDKKSGRFEFGLRELGAEDKTVVLGSERIELNHSTGVGEVVLYDLEVERGMTWEESYDKYLRVKGRFEGYYISKKENTFQGSSGNKYCFLAISESTNPDNDKDYSLYTTYKPNLGLQQNREMLEDILLTHVKVDPEHAKPYWNNLFEKSGTMCTHVFRFSNCYRTKSGRCEAGLRKVHYHLLCGNVLLVWEHIQRCLNHVARLENKKGGNVMKILRAQSSNGFTTIGLLIPSTGKGRLLDDLKKASNEFLKIPAITAPAF